jgi:hypothetical protein
LPRQFDTPLHWSTTDMGLLQYPHLVRTVAQQRFQWRRYYESLMIPDMTWENFVWASECARSRAFAGTFAGNAFNPRIYAFTLLLVTAYVGLGLGTLEQAANGAGLILAASILKGMETYTKSMCVCVCVCLYRQCETLSYLSMVPIQILSCPNCSRQSATSFAQ